jgi:hypothetical protein
MKKIIFIFFLVPFFCSAQDYSTETTSLANFLKRMYNQTSFEGVKIVEDYESQYFISVLSLEKGRYQRESDMFRVAQVKALRQASEYANGSNIVSDLIIRTTENAESASVTLETMEKIRHIGFVQGMELMINFSFSKEPERMVFIYARKIE